MGAQLSTNSVRVTCSSDVGYQHCQVIHILSTGYQQVINIEKSGFYRSKLDESTAADRVLDIYFPVSDPPGRTGVNKDFLFYINPGL